MRIVVSLGRINPVRKNQKTTAEKSRQFFVSRGALLSSPLSEVCRLNTNPTLIWELR